MDHPKHSVSTFEAGSRQMTSATASRRLEAFFAATDAPLHRAFTAKAIIHSGPGGLPMAGPAAQKTLEKLSERKRTGTTMAYLHVPFCETRCLYCMFYQNPYSVEATRAYAKALVKELALWSDRAAQTSAPVHAVYFGGGTPTALEPEDLKTVLEAVHNYLPLANDCEITLEGRIHNFSDAKIEAALAGGVNRFSLGAQTFNTDVRQSMLRVDSRDVMIRRLEKLASYNEAAAVIDLIYGFPGQTAEVWEDDLKTAASLSLDGIDCYQLNVFEKSPLARRIAAGKLPEAADSDMKADLFARSVEFFTTANWRRLSNNHWAMGTRERNIYNTFGKSACDTLAFGCGAGGRLAGHSFMMERDLKTYTETLDRGEKPVGMLLAPKANWALLRTISSAMESGALNLKKIARDYEMPEILHMAEPLLEQWFQAGLLTRRGDWHLQTVAGQYWHVTMAQLLIAWLEPMLPNYVPLTDMMPMGHPGGHPGGHPAGLSKAAGTNGLPMSGGHDHAHGHGRG